MEDGGKHQNMPQDSESLVMVPLTEILLTCVSAHFVKSKVTYISIYKDWYINQAGWHLPRYVSEPVERRNHGGRLLTRVLESHLLLMQEGHLPAQGFLLSFQFVSKHQNF